mgnify:CR=1 FL=1
MKCPLCSSLIPNKKNNSYHACELGDELLEVSHDNFIIFLFSYKSKILDIYYADSMNNNLIEVNLHNQDRDTFDIPFPTQFKHYSKLPNLIEWIQSLPKFIQFL